MKIVLESDPKTDGFEIFPRDYLGPLDLVAAFGRRASVEVDVGSGIGSFLVARAERHPERDFLGIERLLGRVRKTCRRAQEAGLTNVRLLRLETAYALRYLLAPGSIDVVHILFPDPWPKRRHQVRRLIQPAFLQSVLAALAPGGELRIKTDDADYFAHIIEVFRRQSGFETIDWPDCPDDPMTDFEMDFRGKGRPIYRLRMRKL